ncbi:DUF2690 domain-containing protein [Streptomyces sp. H10-C2]|uniref:DUF2690 domain-containing protein n=1 Tax=Streptomyces sp. PH10-H1 TaxID=3046212 RepID=UPI0024B8C74A|nr:MULTISPECIES: DUF2690 domain-containing protein [unclassified Streptomyces]MDJ0344661.1 DUF2690 domain-containing protein [Streptomyces sp. PH10-H1]MDJ0373179.1 DUF2690 domain-containing protein [Streptomyces sp. H10-C2]
MTTYTGQDPQASGCGADAVTMRSATVTSAGTGAAIGTVELRYSVACHAAWTRLKLTGPLAECGPIQPTWGCSYAGALIHRDSNGVEEHCSVNAGQTSCWTNMVDDQGVTSYSKGTIKLGPDTQSATTTSY